MAFVASGSIVVLPAYAKTPESIILVPPTELPEPARQGDEAMLLDEAIDGRALRYIEQSQGARLAILDVTDPRRMK